MNQTNPPECDASDPLPVTGPFETRTSCTLAQNDLLRRVISWLIYRYKIPPTITLGKMEMDHAPVETLIVRRDESGNVFITIHASEMGS